MSNPERAGIIEKLATMDFTEHCAVPGEDGEFPHVHFNADAQPLFYQWWTVNKSRVAKEDNPVIQQHLVKYRSLMPSLALIFHLIEVADGTAAGNVSVRSTNQAIAWCNFLESHARRAYSLASDMPVRAAAKLAVKLRAGQLESGFTARDVQRKGWSLLKDADIIKEACGELVDAGWLKVQQPEKTGWQDKGKTTYIINPFVSKH